MNRYLSMIFFYYNYDNKKVGFLHPKVDELTGDDKPLSDEKMDLLNNIEHKKEKFLPCAQPWSSVHINVDGTVFPCLAVSTGNIQEKNIKAYGLICFLFLNFLDEILSLNRKIVANHNEMVSRFDRIEALLKHEENVTGICFKKPCNCIGHNV